VIYRIKDILEYIVGTKAYSHEKLDTTLHYSLVKQRNVKNTRKYIG